MTVDAVRLALPAEAGRVAALQRRCWAALLPDAFAEAMLTSVDATAMADSWEAAILRPPLATFRVLVATTGAGRVVGFAALGPSGDPDAHPGEDGVIAEFAIDPPARGAGHGSRLLNACIDTLRADGFLRATWWIRTTDDALRAFALGAGWAADGAHTELTTDDDVRVKLIRLHTDITTG